MKFILTSVKVTGNPDASGWAQVHDFFPDDEEKRSLRGRLIAVISTDEKSDGLESVASGREILTRLHEEYFGKTKTSCFNALKDAVEKVIGEFEENQKIKVTIAATSFVEGVVYSVAGNGAKASLFRNDSLVSILESKKGEVIAASGYPEENDVFLLGTDSFFNLFSDGVIKANLKLAGLENTKEAFAARVRSAKGSGSIGAVLIDFKRTQKPIAGLSNQDKPKEKEIKEEPKEKETIREKTVNWLDKVIEKLPTKRIYVKGDTKDLDEKNSRKTALLAGIILLFLLIISIVFGVRARSQRQFKASYKDRLSQAQHNLDEASNLASINKIRSRELFVEAKNIIDKLIEEGIEDEKILEIKQKLDQKEGEILGQYRLQENLFSDLTLFRDDFEADEISSTIDTIYVLDKKGRRVVSVEKESKKTEIAAGQTQVEGALKLASYQDFLYLVKEDGVYETNDNQRVIEDSFNENNLFYSYAANLYFLDKNESKIYRYPGTGGDFGNRSDWLAPGIELDLSDASSWTIDGSIWVLFDDGTLVKLTRGAPEKLKEMGLAPKISKESIIFTDDESEFVYILDRENKRIVAINKEGEFVAQYLNDLIENSIGLTASEALGKMILLTKEGKLFEIEINHLSAS